MYNTRGMLHCSPRSVWRRPDAVQHVVQTRWTVCGASSTGDNAERSTHRLWAQLEREKGATTFVTCPARPPRRPCADERLAAGVSIAQASMAIVIP